MANKIYWWEKPTDILGENDFAEVQCGSNGFNLSFVIDGTKDSAKLIVLSYSKSETLKPYTIVYHEDTNTWWIVANDKVERYENENGFLYKHNLQLEGAIELLNARDLTDCAFNQNTYTITQVVDRLFKLSNFEVQHQIDYANNLIGKTLVEYVKTYENYTLLSALRDFFDGYNCSAKLSFENEGGELTKAKLNIISKTGNTNSSVRNLDTYFDDIKEIRTLNKNSYGTQVVSNAENVISTKAKTYPSVGCVRLSSHENTINRDNAVLRLPSEVAKVNFVDMIKPVNLKFSWTNGTDSSALSLDISDYDAETIAKKLTDALNNWEYTAVGTDINYPVPVRDYYISNADYISKQVIKAMTTRFYNNDNYDPLQYKFLPMSFDGFYFPSVYMLENLVELYNGNVALTNKELRDCVSRKYSAFYWERGKDELSGFNFLGLDGNNVSYLNSYDSTELKEANIVVLENNDPTHLMQSSCYFGKSANGKVAIVFDAKNTYWRVNYIPMGDLKIKYDNYGDSNNVKLYNQNGRLTDANGLSRLLSSYKNEIESENITRYKIGYDFSSLANIGDVFVKNSTRYVANNVSISVFQNEIVRTTPTRTKQTYYYVCEYTLSKKVAVKSLLVNPNTNIRDYGIPQNYNVKRRQLYRDFYEFAHSVDDSADNSWHLPITKLLKLGQTYENFDEHTAVIKVKYSSPIGGGGVDPNGNTTQPSDTWYYQLDTTTFLLKKSIYEVVDFKDNNIIGYGAQNVITGWFIDRVLSGSIDAINTPISYVDDSGRIKDMTLAFCTNDVLSSIYRVFSAINDSTKVLTNYSCFVDEFIYEGDTTYDGAKDLYDFMIEEIDYNKDALEVPVFEYSCQLDNSDDVDIGENIFEYDNVEDSDSFFYIYSIVLANKNTIDENNALTIAPKPRIIINQQSLDEEYIRIDDTATFVVDNDKIELHPRLYTRYNIQTGVLSNGANITIPATFKNKDIAIFRHKINKDYETYVEEGTTYAKCKTDLIFIVRNNENISTEINYIPLYVNHYKLN